VKIGTFWVFFGPEIAFLRSEMGIFALKMGVFGAGSGLFLIVSLDPSDAESEARSRDPGAPEMNKSSENRHFLGVFWARNRVFEVGNGYFCAENGCFWRW
jgi:hypothetical protein